jgi:diguanylate cyclase (GGDEF)-like protein
MNSSALSVVVVPAVMAFLLFLVFTYLYRQSRQQYLRAWQLGWAAYTVRDLLTAWGELRSPLWWIPLANSLLLVAMAVCIFVSTRLVRERFRVRWQDFAILAAGAALAFWNNGGPLLGGLARYQFRWNNLRLEIGLSVLLFYCSFHFYRAARRKISLALYLLSLSLALWATVLVVGQIENPFTQMFGAAGQMLLAISMVMVLYENERNAVQEGALAFSTLGVDPKHLLSPEDLKPSIQNLLDRLVAPLPAERAMICVTDRWRAALPSVQRGLSDDLLQKMQDSGAGQYICELAYRRGGFVSLRNIPDMQEPLPAFPGGRFQQFRGLMREHSIREVTAVGLQTRENNFGVVLFPHADRREFGASNLRLLIGLALQIGLTLENYVVMHDAQRRTKEYELLTQIGQAISSRLDQDEVLRTVQKELGQIFDTNNFYVAFHEGESIEFELEIEKGVVLPKRTRKVDNGLTEYMLRTGQPLMILTDLENARERLGVTFTGPNPAKSFCGAPILLGGKPAGVMVAMSTEHEYMFEARDLEVMQTAAGQVSVAIENARLFSEEQRRSRQLAFLNNISKTAISSESSEQMLSDIVAEIQKTFSFDHIGIGIMDYATKDIEIRAEAGFTTLALGKRIPVGTGILGRVARTGEKALVQMAGEGQVQGVLPGARAVLCLPITYSETLMGVLNVESLHEDAFSPEDVLVLNTLADLLATALHNSFVFQKMQQQSITDGLTGIKTRRFFWEALLSERQRASRSARPFSLVLIDLDKFKEVNDGSGHLEGDLVLARVGRLLEQKCRQSNVVARYGGDEFVILMPETSVDQAQTLAERLRLWLSSDPMLSEHGITGSFGVASYPAHGLSAEDILRVADAGMYVSKHAGGDRVSIAEEFAQGETATVQRQLIGDYIDGFLHREHTGPEQLNELVSTLNKLRGDDDEDADGLRDSIEAMSRTAESRETNNSGHGEMVGRYAEILGQALEFSPEEISDLAYVGRVHDVGKIFVPERILNKPGQLTEDEFAKVKLHAHVGAEIVGTIPESEMMKKAIESHHEAFDGSGYPAGLRGEQIPLWGRILAIADAYVNLTTDRSFSSGKTSEQSLAEMEKLSGVRYDGMLVRILMRELRGEKPSRSRNAF